MGSNTKWIDSRPEELASDVARRALGRHVARMLRYLERAVSEPPSQTENVHQLRVFSRRAAAVMDIFAGWLPSRRGERMQKQVRKVRKAAGEARDFDVLHLRWAEYTRHAPSSHAALLVEQIKQRRNAAQPRIEHIHKRLARKRFSRRVKKLLKRLRAPTELERCGERFGCFARIALGPLVGPFLQAAAGELEDAAAMHAFRIQSKQVRYAMEIFAGAFDDDFRKELYPLVATLQDRLGAINDHVTAQTYFAAWHADADSAAVRGALEMAIDREQQGLETSRREFLDWWTTGRREDLGRRFQRYVDLNGAPAAAAQRCAD
jgi:CHAD domain-containing protein